MDEKQKRIKEYEEEYCKNLMGYCKTYNILGISALSAGVALANLSLPDVYVPLEIERAKNEVSPLAISRGIYGEVGSGKTALLQMYTYAFLSLYYPEEYYPLAEYFRAELGCGMNPKLPIYLSIPRFESRSFEGIEEVLVSAMADFLESDSGDKEIAKEKAVELFHAQRDLCIIIDGIDAFREEEKKQLFQAQIINHMQENPKIEWILSSRYAEDMDFCKDILDVYKLKALEGENRRFVFKWLEAVCGTDVETLERAKLSYEKAVKRNVSLMRVKNPLELTCVLLQAYYNHFDFPIRIEEIYENKLNLKISWNADLRYTIQDVKYQLAYIAYRMSLKKSKSYLTMEQLFQCLYDARMDQAWFYDQEWGVEIEKIAEFVDYLVTQIGILEYVSSHDCYKFSFFIDRYYLAAYCISDKLFSKEESRKSALEFLKKVELPVVREVFRREDELREGILEWLADESKSDKVDKVVNDRKFWLVYVEIFAVDDVRFSLEEKRTMWEMFLKEGDSSLRSVSNSSFEAMTLPIFFSKCSERELEVLWKLTMEFLGQKETCENNSIIKHHMMRIWIWALLTENTSEFLVECIWKNLPHALIVENLITMYKRLIIPNRTKEIIKRMALNALLQEENPSPAYGIAVALNLSYDIENIIPMATFLLGGNIRGQVIGINYIHLVFNFYKYRELVKGDIGRQQVVEGCQKLVRSHLYYCIEQGYEDYLLWDCIHVYSIVYGHRFGEMEKDDTLLFYMMDFAKRTMKKENESLEKRISCALLDLSTQFCLAFGHLKGVDNAHAALKRVVFTLYLHPKDRMLWKSANPIPKEMLDAPKILRNYIEDEMRNILKNIFSIDDLPHAWNFRIRRYAKKYIRMMRIK